jgi:hypothetical protein
MTCLKTYTYTLTEDEIKACITEYFNKKYNNKHLPITKANVKIEFEHEPYCEPKPVATIEIDEEDNS